MKHIDINEVYTLFEEIKELVKKGSENKPTVVQPEVQPKIELPDFSEINELTNKLDKTIEEARKPVVQERHFIINLVSSETIFICVGLIIIIVGLTSWLYFATRPNYDRDDNDLKYRYILMQGEVSPKELNQLEAIFENRRDSVKIIRNQVERYEKALMEEAKRLEQARLKEQEAERLREEAEQIKPKK
jgi:hypothetical protein